MNIIIDLYTILLSHLGVRTTLRLYKPYDYSCLRLSKFNKEYEYSWLFSAE